MDAWRRMVIAHERMMRGPAPSHALYDGPGATPYVLAQQCGAWLAKFKAKSEPTYDEREAAPKLRAAIRDYLDWWLEWAWSDRDDPTVSRADLREVKFWAGRGIESRTHRVCRCGTVFRREPEQRRYCSDACRKARPVAIPAEYRVWHDISAEAGAQTVEQLREARRAREARGPAALGRRDPDRGRVEFLVSCECGADVFARPGQRALCPDCASAAGRKRRERARQ